jgi:chemotaxis protein histidine kinase CheA
MDHGLETAEARQAAGKDPVGHIQLEMSVQDGRLLMRLHDDGRGLAVAKIRGKAIDNGVLDAAATPSDEEVANLIFASGFSTAGKVTEVSGRGVGMDAVKGFLQKEGGDVVIRFRGGQEGDGWRPFELQISLPDKHAAVVQPLAA